VAAIADEEPPGVITVYNDVCCSKLKSWTYRSVGEMGSTQATIAVKSGLFSSLRPVRR
jgi:secreted protein with Ig-like and vWFA domain